MRDKIVNTAQIYLGITGKGCDLHKVLVNIYNEIRPLPRNYKLKYTDSYCAAAVTVWFKESGLLDLITPECGVQEMINGAMEKGIWVEDDFYTPKKGDLICFHWNGKEGKDNTGVGNHIALVESVSGQLINTINPNTNGGKCVRTAFVVGDKDIRGFICPKYTEYAKNQTCMLKKHYFYTSPDVFYNKCSVELDDGNGVRDYLMTTDKFEVIKTSGDFIQIKVVGKKYTWKPWVLKNEVEVK